MTPDQVYEILSGPEAADVIPDMGKSLNAGNVIWFTENDTPQAKVFLMKSLIQPFPDALPGTEALHKLFSMPVGQLWICFVVETRPETNSTAPPIKGITSAGRRARLRRRRRIP
jgi:hypothetical protein